MKEIICYDDTCIFHKFHHCRNNKVFLTINKDGCSDYEYNPHYEKQINETLAEQNEGEKK